MTYKAYLFDMDGTVLDTLQDLRDALHAALAHFGHRHDYNLTQIGAFFGSGIVVAVKRALAFEAGMPLKELEFVGTPEEVLPAALSNDDFMEEVNRIVTWYKPYYEAHCADRTAPYEGIVPLLKRLRADNMLTAVISNKPDEAVQKLAADYFPGLFDYVVGEKPHVRRKPAPDMITDALTALHIAAEDAVYIGDSEIDLQTAKAAGIPCISVVWGFRSREFLTAHGANLLAETPADIYEIRER